jgi:hypothetical protein
MVKTPFSQMRAAGIVERGPGDRLKRRVTQQGERIAEF